MGGDDSEVALSVVVSSTVVRSVWLVTGADGQLPVGVTPAPLAEMEEENADVAGVLVACRLVGVPVVKGLPVVLVGVACCVLTSRASVLGRREEERLGALRAGGVLETGRV